MNQQNHLTDREIEKYIGASYSSGIDSESLESHVAKCAHCRARLLQLERQQLGVLETGLGSATPTPECPAEEDLQKFVMDACPPDIAERIIQHVTDCSYCAPMLKIYLDAMENVPDRKRRTLLQRLVYLIQFLVRRPVWFKTALAGGMSLVLTFFWPGPVLMNLYQLHEAEGYAAAFAQEEPPNEMRMSWCPYPKAAFRTMAGRKPLPMDYPNLASAEHFAAEKLNSTDPRWIRLRGRLKLLHGENDDAARLFVAATEKGLNDPATEIDLAVAYFQRNIDSQASDSKSSVKFSENLELFAKVLREPKLGQQERAIATFDEAVVYEKMQLWGQAVLTWEEYLDIDVASPWHDEAVRRLEKAKAKVSLKPQGYREPAFLLRHFADLVVQKNLEEYQSIALRTWLPIAAAHQDSEEAVAIRKLAQLLQERHGDAWMLDFLAERRPGDLPALHALRDAVANNQHGKYIAAEKAAGDAVRAFNKNGNYPGALLARFERVYALQQILDKENCLKQAEDLENEVPARYPWLQVQVALEQGVCMNLDGQVKSAEQQLDWARERAKRVGLNFLALREHALSAAIQVGTNCNATWQSVQAGLELYWSGPDSSQRLYEFLSPIKQCFETRRLWHAAEVFERSMIKLLEQKTHPDDENVLLEVTAHRALGQILRELGDYQAAEDQERIALLLLPQVEKAIASTYEIPIKLSLADLKLDQGDSESALETIRGIEDIIDPSDAKFTSVGAAKNGINQTDKPFFRLTLLRIRGDIHLARQQWDEAGEDYKKGIETAEDRLRQFVNEDERRQWAEEAGDVYRGLVEVFLRQNRNEEALQLWEWYQARPLQQKPDPNPGLAGPKWDQIEQTILTRPLPPPSVTRLVYASTRNYLHIWTISRTGIRAVSVAENREDLRRKIRQFVEKCGMRQNPKLQVPAPDLEGRDLFSQLLQPVIAHLRPSETVVIDLDVGMTRLPLEALKSPEGWYFGEEFPVVYSPGYLRETGLRPPEKPRMGLRIDALGPGESNWFSSVFPEIAAVDGGDMRPAVLRSRLETSEIFAFFGHGDDSGGLLLRKEGPSLSAKYFPAAALQHMRLAVLVACSTGVPTDEFLDTSNLVNAFHSGGTPSVVASHWDVNMEATSFLMKSFSTHVDHGEPIVEALFEARKETMHQYAHPYYWAGFVLSGRA